MADKAVVTQSTLDAIGQAIIAKGGATAAMTPAQMPAAIASIPSGEPGWGYGLEPIGGWKQNRDATFVWITVDDSLDIKFSFATTGTVLVEWGDGRSDSFTDKSFGDVSHNYSAAGDYIVSFTSVGGGVIVHSGNNTFFGTNISQPDMFISRQVRYAQIGNNFTSTNASRSPFSLASNIFGLRIDSSKFDLMANSFLTGNVNLKNIEFVRCGSSFVLKPISAATSIKSCYFTVPITDIPDSFLNGCYNIENFVIPDSCATIGTSGLRNLYSLTRLVIGSSVQSVGTYGISGNYALREIVCKPIHPPVLTSAFNVANDCVITVPYTEDHSALQEYKTANNWSAFASKMVEGEV